MGVHCLGVHHPVMECTVSCACDRCLTLEPFRLYPEEYIKIQPFSHDYQKIGFKTLSFQYGFVLKY